MFIHSSFYALGTDLLDFQCFEVDLLDFLASK